LKDNFAQVAQHGDAVALFFYSDLFLRNPKLRDMFPIGMSHQRDRLLSALGRIVSQVDNLADLVPFVRQLGADHRKFGVEALHYPEVGQSLVTTLRYFSGAAWNDTLAKDWTDDAGATHRTGETVDVDPVTLAKLEAAGIVWRGPTGDDGKPNAARFGATRTD